MVFLGIDQDIRFLDLSKLRREEINDCDVRIAYSKKIKDMAFMLSPQTVCEDLNSGYDLPF